MGALRSVAVTSYSGVGDPQREEPEAGSEVDDAGATDLGLRMLVDRGERGVAVVGSAALEPFQGVAVEPQPRRERPVDGGADDAGEDQLELGLPVQHAGVVEFLGDQHRQLVAQLIGTKVVLDGEQPPWRRAQNRGVHRLLVGVGAVRPGPADHPHAAALHTPASRSQRVQDGGADALLGSSSSSSCLVLRSAGVRRCVHGRCVHEGMAPMRSC